MVARSLVVPVGIALVVGVLCGAGGVRLYQDRTSAHLRDELDAEFHTVLLTNNQAYFGKIEQRGQEYLLLTDVYYVQTQVDPESQKRSTVLVKRGNEMHGPSKMLVNVEHVVFIEPVGADSTLGKSIFEAKKKQ